MKMPKKINVDILRLILDYDASNGSLTWRPRSIDLFCDGGGDPEKRKNRWNAQFSGKPAFKSECSKGYLTGSIFDVTFQAHRVAWALHYGKWPLGCIDHVNGDKKDNRIENMRDVSVSENNRNLAKSPSNKSGFVGVFWDKKRERWRAMVGKENRRVHVGYFFNQDDAVSAAYVARRDHGYHENHGRVLDPVAKV